MPMSLVLILVMGFPKRCLGSTFEADPYSLEVRCWLMFNKSAKGKVFCMFNFIKIFFKTYNKFAVKDSRPCRLGGLRK